MSIRYAYVAGGRLHVKAGEAPARDYPSNFANTLRQQREDTQRQRAWQKKSMVSGFAPPSLVQRLTELEAPAMPVQICGLCRGGDGLFYALQAAEVGAFLTLQPEKASERRLFHSAELRVEHPAHNSELGLVACTVAYPDGSYHLGVMRETGNRPDECTEGAGMELAPSWVPGAGKKLVFQAAGVARSHEGYVQDRTTFTIEQLDLESGEISPVASETDHDLLSPRMLADGTLLCIRKPRKEARPGVGRMVLGVLAMPFLFVIAMGRAFFAWCNFFTWRHTGRELTQQLGTAGAREAKNAPPARLQAWGEWLSPKDMPRGKKNLDEAPAAWVPSDWELVRRKPGADFETVARGVLAFDCAPDGTLLYTDGGSIHLISPDGGKRRLHQQAAISALVWLPPDGEGQAAGEGRLAPA